MISIVLCTYNRAHTLKETIDSILRQTYRDFELIIVDDGSTDATLELLKTYKDERIRIFPQKENQYYCIAANYGIQQMRGEYLAFATSDDTWEQQKLARQINLLTSESKYAACFTFSDVIDENSRPADDKFEMLSGLLMKNHTNQRDWIQQFIFEGNCLCHPSAVIRREVIEAVGSFNLMYCQAGDMELWLRIIRRYPVYVIEQALVHYRCYKNPLEQVSGADELKAARFFNEHMLIRRNFIEDLSDEEMQRFFGNCFQKRDAATHMELEIEKALLLMNCTHHLPDLRILGIEKLERLLRNPEVLEVLKNDYGISIHDIYEWNKGHFYMDFGIHVRLANQDRICNELKERIESQKGELDRNQNLLDEQEEILVEKIKDIESKNRELKELKEFKDKLEESIKEQSLALTVAKKDLEKSEQERAEMEALLEQAVLDNLRIKEEASKRGIGKRRQR